jgi:hypothetical protein
MRQLQLHVTQGAREDNIADNPQSDDKPHHDGTEGATCHDGRWRGDIDVHRQCYRHNDSRAVEWHGDQQGDYRLPSNRTGVGFA